MRLLGASVPAYTLPSPYFSVSMHLSILTGLLSAIACSLYSQLKPTWPCLSWLWSLIEFCACRKWVIWNLIMWMWFTVLDTDTLHFSKEFLDLPVQADTDICTDALKISAWFRAEESRQEFRADSSGKWRKPVTYVHSVACEADPAWLTASLVYV